MTLNDSSFISPDLKLDGDVHQELREGLVLPVELLHPAPHLLEKLVTRLLELGQARLVEAAHLPHIAPATPSALLRVLRQLLKGGYPLSEDFPSPQ